MPGSHEEAKVAFKLFKDPDFYNSLYDRISDREPTGSSRHVYKVGDVVYKIDNWIRDNRREYKMFTHFKGESWSSPVSLYPVGRKTILCMPYYQFRLSDIYEDISHNVHKKLNEIEILWCEWARKQRNGKFANPDFHGGNYRFDSSGQLKIIDGAGIGWA